MAVVELVLEAVHSVAEIDLAAEIGLGEQFQGAGDGGVADVGVFSPDDIVEFLGADVLFGPQKGIDDILTRLGLTKRLLPQKFIEFQFRIHIQCPY